MIGFTNPLNTASGTFRADTCIDLGRNMVFSSETAEIAKREI